ncbi:MAG: glutamyl-tRNA reductase [Desulfobacteraceae bacterium]
MPQIILTGLNHKTAPVELRERLAVGDSQLPGALEKLSLPDRIHEIVLFSTCNRTEIVFTAEDDKAVDTVKELLAEFKNIRVDEFENALYTYKDDKAVAHLFKVASSLDSMVVGEPQILGQVKKAYRSSVACNTSGVILNRLLHKTFSVAKRVRKETGIGDNAVSISYAATELAGKIFSDLSTKRVMLIGAGEMAELAVEHLISHHVSRITVVNRTFENAVQLADKFKGEAVKYEEMEAALKDADIIISSTGAEGYVLQAGQVKQVMKKRKHRPLFFIDIALPRDLDPNINRINNAYLYDIDDLKSIVNRNMEKRHQETVKAERIIEEAVVKFRKWLQDLEVVPTIVAIKEKIEKITEIETGKTIASMSSLSTEDEEAIRRMAQAIASRIMHDPILFLKDTGAHRKDSFYLNAARQLFNLDPDDEEKPS